MRLGSGIARIKEMIDAGVKVSLGVDGSASNDSGNMLLEIRNAMLLSRLREEKYWLGARDVLRMATNGGAKALGRNDIGELSVGKQADLSLFSMNHIEYAGGMSDPLAALVFSARTNPVDYLIVKGEILIDKGESKLDEAKLILEHNAISKKMIDQAKKNTGINFI
jgi:cytosine/adenosine deaminase-related metal-dependent hydrolase